MVGGCAIGSTAGVCGATIRRLKYSVAEKRLSDVADVSYQFWMWQHPVSVWQVSSNSILMMTWFVSVVDMSCSESGLRRTLEHC